MLHNLTTWQAVVLDSWDQNKAATKAVIVKQSFEFDGQGHVFPMENSDDIIMADEMHGEPVSSSLKHANEAVPFKKGFELYGNLTAYPPKSKQAKVIEVCLSLVQEQTTIFNKVLRVTGERTWQPSLLGTKASDPQRLKPTPLTYENTYGGVDANKPERVFETNPVGIGYKVKNYKGSKLPCVEYPNQFIKHPKKEIAAASYGAIAAFWQPRLSLMPDIEQEQMMSGEYPYKNKLSAHFYNCAPQDQQLNITFKPDTQLVLKGVLPNRDYHQHVSVALPFQPPLVAIIKGENQTFIDLTCDTLILDADANVFHLLWRKNVAKAEVSAHANIVIQQNEKQAVTKSDALNEQSSEVNQANPVNNNSHQVIS